MPPISYQVRQLIKAELEKLITTSLSKYKENLKSQKMQTVTEDLSRISKSGKL